MDLDELLHGIEKPAGLLLSEALSYRERQDALRVSLKQAHGAAWVYLEAIYDDEAIYRVEMPRPRAGSPEIDLPHDPDRYFRCAWSIVDDEVKIGEMDEVKRIVSYEPVKVGESLTIRESATPLDIIGDTIALTEGSTAADGTFPVKIIKAGWSLNKRYYGKEMLARDAASAFPAGTLMHWNHPTAKEARERPEGDLNATAGALVQSASWQEDGFDGPGVYSRAKAFPSHAESIKAMGPYIGLSIHAGGKGATAEAEGRKGTVVTELAPQDGFNSVDFVTVAGAGGKYQSLFESARGGAKTNAQPQKEAHEMADATQELQEAQGRITALEAERAERDTKIAELTEANRTLTEQVASMQADKVLTDGRTVIETALAEAKLPELTVKRIGESLKADLPIAEGKLDEAALSSNIQTAVEEARAEIAAVSGTGVSDMGTATGPVDESGKSALKAQFKGRFLEQGLSPEEAERRAELAVSR